MDDIKDSTPPVRCYSYIRFSSKEQRKGDSLRRQTAYAEEYAKEKGLILDDSLKITDLGFSAFHGDHISKGALGVFLEQVKAGKIPKGSHLVIEALDRLSREDLSESYTLFMNLIMEGIVICTAADNMVYHKEGLDMLHVMFSAFKLAQGHEESLKKQQRILKAWEQKRANASIKKLTKLSPSWLQLSDDKTTFLVITERAEVIKQIFKMKLDGLGADRIARELNRSQCWKPQSPHGKKLIGWHKSYIYKVLRYKAVLGEYQPHSTILNKRRLPAGEPISNYYPRIIEDDVFFAVQEQIERNLGKGGKNGRFHNLFSGLVKCGYCGSSMQFIKMGPSNNNRQYLLCDQARRALGCPFISVPYQPLEDLVLKYCKGLDPAGILPDSSATQSKILTLQNSLAVQRGKMKDVERKITNLMNAIAESESKRVRDKLQVQLDDFMGESELLRESEKIILDEIAQLTSIHSVTQKQIESINELIWTLPTATPEIRASLRNRIRSLVNKIVIYPVGKPYMTEEYVEELLIALKDVNPEVTDAEISQERQRLKNKIGNKKLAYCDIFFRSGSISSLNLARYPEMPMEVDREAGKAYNRFINQDGDEERLTIIK